MKVAYVTMRFPEPSETFASNEVRILRGLGTDITVHGLRRRRADAEQLLHDRQLAGLPTTHNRGIASIRGLWTALLQPRLLAQAVSWIVRSNRSRRRDLALSLLLLPRAFDILAAIGRDRPDVVHMYWGHLPSLVGFLVQRRHPHIVTSLAIVAYDLRREYGGTVDVARRADVIRTHAIVNVEHIVRFTGVARESVNVIYNGVDADKLSDVARNHPKVRHRIATVARLIESKGTDRVLQAFASVRRRWPDATLVVVGSGPDSERLMALSQEYGLGDSVDFKGYLPHDQAVAEVAQAEIFMLLSRSRDDRLPNVVKEGMACGCICITTPTPGIEELVIPNVTGFIVPASEPDAAAQAIDGVFSGKIDGTEMVAAALAHVRDCFDVYRTAPRYRELWESALERRVADRGTTMTEAAIREPKPSGTVDARSN